MLKTTILILYFATGSTTTGMAVATVEFATREACESAGQQAKSKLGGWATGVYWVCASKGETGPAAPQSR